MSQHSVKVLCNIFECTGSIKHKILFPYRILRLENHRNVKMANSQPGVFQQKPKIPADSLFYEFSPEEKKVMQDCNRDSFYQRSLPLSLIFSAGTYMVINAGFLKRSVKWGFWPKTIGAGLLGYVIGKYSYQNICAERLMQIPNSELGRVLRERRGKAKGENVEGNMIFPTIRPGNPDTDVPSFAADYKSDIDIDTHKPMNSLDTDYRPNYDGLLSSKDNEYPLSSYNSPTSYDELRARNRQEFERTQPNKTVYRPPPSANTQPTWDTLYPPFDQTRSPQTKESRNQYGDVV